MKNTIEDPLIIKYTKHVTFIKSGHLKNDEFHELVDLSEAVKLKEGNWHLKQEQIALLDGIKALQDEIEQQKQLMADMAEVLQGLQPLRQSVVDKLLIKYNESIKNK